MRVRKGTIVRLDANRLSGVAELVVDEVIGKEVKRVAVPCDHSQTLRVLKAISDTPEGMELFFVVDNGVLEEITPVDDAPPELVRIYEEAIP